VRVTSDQHEIVLQDESRDPQVVDGNWRVGLCRLQPSLPVARVDLTLTLDDLVKYWVRQPSADEIGKVGLLCSPDRRLRQFVKDHLIDAELLPLCPLTKSTINFMRHSPDCVLNCMRFHACFMANHARIDQASLAKLPGVEFT